MYVCQREEMCACVCVQTVCECSSETLIKLSDGAAD